jgi:predicted small lipoprotein YifL
MMLDAMKLTNPLLLHILLCVALTGCGDDGTVGTPPATVDAAAPDAAVDAGIDATTVRTYAGDIQPIWTNRCMPCHIEDEARPLLPRLAMGRVALVNQPSRQVTTLDLIEPGAPNASYLWLKLINEHKTLSSTEPMPPAALGGTFEPIPASELEVIRAWIVAGAGTTW